MLERRPIAGTDLVVSQICLGSNMYGSQLNKADVDTLLDRFQVCRGNFIDTARCYGDWVPHLPRGAAERLIGAWLRDRRPKDFVIATKGGFSELRDMQSGAWKSTLRMTPEHITSDLLQSLEHLDVRAIDLYWVHVDDPSKPIEPIIDCMIEHRKAGRIRYFGLSNFSPQRIMAAQGYAHSLSEQGPVAIQPFWSLATPNVKEAAIQGYYRHFESGYRPFLEQGTAIVTYGSQSRGFFAKYEKDGEGMRQDVKAMFLNDSNLSKLEVLRRISKTRRIPIATLTTAYMTSQPKNVIPIVGASNLAQLEESVTAAAVKLTDAEIEELRACQ